MSHNSYIIANWKMNTPSLAAWAQPVALACVGEAAEVVVCPPFTQLAAAQMVFTNTPIHLGGQDCHAEDSGAFTGDISVPMLKRSGCSYVIVGHSERRKYHGEGDDLVWRKAATALRHDVTPIVCVGETLQQREAGQTLDILKEQLASAVLVKGDYVVAYEPVWAIGTGVNATDEAIVEAHQFIKKQLNNRVPVVYGGSVKPDNAGAIMQLDAVNGVLVGGASLDGESFAKIIVAGARA